MGLLLWVALALAAGPTKPKGPSDPGFARSPYQTPEQVPPLGGASGSLDLNTLGRTITTFTLEADVSELDRVTAANRGQVLAGLMADPRWRVVDEGANVVAYRRTQDGGAWSVPFAGFHRGDADAWRAAVRCGKRPPADSWLGPQVGHALASAPSIKVQSFHPRVPAGWAAMAASWDGKECALEIYEAQAGKDLDLTHTASLIAIAPQQLGALVDGVDYTYPRGEPVVGEPKVTVGWRAGQLDVRGRAHPPGPGVIWVRLVDPAGLAWEERWVGVGTRERIGWSAKPEQMYYFQGAFPVPKGPGFAGTAEVWFQPATGAASRLHAVPVTVPARD
jgi:hypothetical protein